MGFFLKCIKIKLFVFTALEKSLVRTPKIIAFGFSLSSLPLLERLKEINNNVQIFCSVGSAFSLEREYKDLKQSTPVDFLQDHWQKNNKLIFIGSVGAVVRLIAPFVNSKERDPAVLVMDSKAKNVISLLGGHISGGDQLAVELASDLDASAIFTADSSSEERIPLDCFGEGWGWKRGGEISDWRKLMISQSREEKTNIFQANGSKLWQSLKACSNYSFLDKKIGILSKNIDLYIGKDSGNKCSWHTPSIIVGIGCIRNTDEKMILRAIKESFSKNRLSLKSVSGIATIDKKNDEIGLLNLSRKNEWPIYFFNALELSKVNVPNPSNAVMNEMGTASVAEAAAILRGTEKGRLIQEKQIFRASEDEFGGVTIALVELEKPLAPHKGELHLVGSGPGKLEMLTSDSRRALTRCVAWIGYAPYLNYLDSIRRHDQVRVDSQLTFEKNRCQQALNLAQEGAKVALVSSGDSGIYGMAGLALEIWLNESVESRPLLQVHPGISSFQMAAAKLGAPFMNDFCSISLSDLLTPWKQIEQRIISAGKGDFVLAIFNPKSIKRDWQLKKTVELLLKFREPNTPIAIARQLGRFEENVQVYTLETLPFNQVDMLTILIVGNSQSFVKNNKFLTPRGYFKN